MPDPNTYIAVQHDDYPGQTFQIPQSSIPQALKDKWRVAPPNMQPAFRKPESGITTGLMSPDTAVRALSGQAGQDVSQQADAPPRIGQSPEDYASQVGRADATQREGRFLSSLTSPLSVATMGLGALGRIPGSLGTLARGATTAVGAGLGLQAAPGIVSSASDIASRGANPQNTEQLLSSGSQLAGAAGALKQVGLGTKNLITQGIDSVLPSGTNAVISALKPTGKELKTIRQNIDAAEPEIQAASPKSLDEFAKLTGDKRVQAGQAIDQAITAAGKINTIDGQAIRQQIAPVSRVIQAQNPKAQQAVSAFVDRLLSKPVTVSDADVMIKDLTAQQSDLRGMSPAERADALKQDPSLMAVDQLKNALVNQIDQKLGGMGLSDARKKYAIWSSLDDAATRRVNQVAKQDPISWMTRRALEGGGATIAAGVGAALGGHDAGSMLGSAGIGAGVTKIGTDFFINRLNNPDYLISRGSQYPASQRPPVNLGGVPIAAAAAGQRQ